MCVFIFLTPHSAHTPLPSLPMTFDPNAVTFHTVREYIYNVCRYVIMYMFCCLYIVYIDKHDIYLSLTPQ